MPNQVRQGFESRLNLGEGEYETLTFNGSPSAARDAGEKVIREIAVSAADAAGMLGLLEVVPFPHPTDFGPGGGEGNTAEWWAEVAGPPEVRPQVARPPRPTPKRKRRAA